jgi:hypothetical protein
MSSPESVVVDVLSSVFLAVAFPVFSMLTDSRLYPAHVQACPP